MQWSKIPKASSVMWDSKFRNTGVVSAARNYSTQISSSHQWRRNEFQSRGGGTRPAQLKRRIFLSCPSTFLALKVQLVVLASAFVMASTVWSVSWLLCFYSRCSPVPSHLKKLGARAPRAIWNGAGASHSSNGKSVCRR